MSGYYHTASYFGSKGAAIHLGRSVEIIERNNYGSFCATLRDQGLPCHTKVEKIVLSLANPEDTRLVLKRMMDYGVFNEPKPLLEIVNHLYINREDKEEERQVLEPPGYDLQFILI